MGRPQHQVVSLYKPSTRKKKNTIEGIMDTNCWKEDERDLENIFANIFSTSNPSSADLENVVSKVQRVVTEDMNALLIAP